MWSLFKNNILEELQQVFWGGRLLYLFFASLIYLWFFEKTQRKALVVPSALIVVILLNPVLYSYFWRPLMKNYAFARLLWMVPVLQVVGVAVVSVLSKCKKRWGQLLVLTCVCIIAIFSGKYVYMYTGSGTTGFIRATNPYHLPETVILVSDYLLELTETPRIVVDMGLSPYMRQYSSKIQQYCGRYASAGGVALQMGDEMMKSEPDLDWIREKMMETRYEYFIFNSRDRSKEFYESKGFHFLKEVGTENQKRNIYKLKYSFTIEPANVDYSFEKIPIYFYSGNRYHISIDSVSLNSGNAKAFSILLYDWEGRETIDYEIISFDDKGKANNIDVSFSIPNNDSVRDRYQVLLYAGIQGQTANNGVTYSGVYVEEE